MRVRDKIQLVPLLHMVLPYGLVVMALMLALKNPYDTQSLIPNLEPYPDTLFYAYPAMRFVTSGDFSMFTEVVNPRIVTPPGFSLLLMPVFALSRNVLSFFWLQIVLLVVSVYALARAARALFPRTFVAQFVTGFLFVVNFYIFTMPSLLMAELVTVAGVCMMVWLYGLPKESMKSVKHAIWLPLIAVYMSAIKFSNAPMTILFVVARRRHWLIGGCAMLALGLWVWQSGILVGHKNLQEGASFSPAYMKGNLDFYVRALLGLPTRYLWYQERLMSPLVSLVGLAGLGAGLWSKPLRRTSALLLAMCVGQVLFMSAFVTPDARYISMLIPIVCIGVGMFMYILAQRVGPAFASVAGLLFVLLVLGVPHFSQSPTGEVYTITLKRQIGLNYLHPENPWNYMAAQEMNAFVEKTHGNSPLPPVYIGTFLPPQYVSFFAKGFTPAPITFKQEFFSPHTTLPAGHTAVPDYYSALLADGARVYVTDAYAANNRADWPSALDELLNEFEYEIVHTGCEKTCRIFELKERESGN